MKKLILFFYVGTFSLVACKHSETKTEEVRKYSATSPLVKDTTYTKEYVAQIQSVKNVELRAQEKGYLETINADEGSFVKAGQVIFTIVPGLFDAEVQKATATLKEAELEMLNTQSLADKNIVSASELAISKAKYDEAKAELSLAQLHLSYTQIKAPFDGVIDRIPFKRGSLIDEGALLTTLSDNSNVFAYFNVPESEYLQYKTQTTSSEYSQVSLLLANNQLHKYKGVIETVEGQFDNETGNIAFRAKFPNPEFLLKHGETGKVIVKVPIKGALIIPQKATYEIQDKFYVFVIDKDNKVHSRNITIKNALNDLYIIDSGLNADEKILLEGVQNVKDDDKIEYEFLTPEKVISSLQLIHS